MLALRHIQGLRKLLKWLRHVSARLGVGAPVEEAARNSCEIRSITTYLLTPGKIKEREVRAKTQMELTGWWITSWAACIFRILYLPSPDVQAFLDRPP